MRLAILGILLFVVPFAVHVVVWRIRRPRRRAVFLLLLFLGALPVAAALPHWPALASTLADWAPGSPAAWLQLTLLQVALTLAYVFTYAAVEEDSTSLSLVRYVARAGPHGRTHDELRNLLRDRPLVSLRLEATVEGGWVEQRDDHYALTARGRRWCQLFLAAQRVLGLKMGG